MLHPPAVKFFSFEATLSICLFCPIECVLLMFIKDDALLLVSQASDHNIKCESPIAFICSLPTITTPCRVLVCSVLLALPPTPRFWRQMSCVDFMSSLLIVLWPLTNYLTCLSFSFLICNRIIILLLQFLPPGVLVKIKQNNSSIYSRTK